MKNNKLKFVSLFKFNYNNKIMIIIFQNMIKKSYKINNQLMKTLLQNKKNNKIQNIFK